MAKVSTYTELTAGQLNNTADYFSVSDAGAATKKINATNILAAPPAIGGTTPAAGAFTTLDATTDITIKDSTRGGGLVRKPFKASSAAMSGASVTIQVNIPATSRIIGVQLIVDTAITSGDGGTTWSAAFSGGDTGSICAGQAFTKDTAVNSLVSATVTSETDIAITPDSGTFNAGVITAVVTYECFEALSAA